jgi:hypothetical protein
MGGLGNQLFQFAAGRRIALRCGVELVLDLGWFRHEAAAFATPRTYELGPIASNLRAIELSPREIEGLEGTRRRPRSTPRLRVIRQRDGDHSVDERVLEAGDDVLLVGFWQSEAYFADIVGVLRSELRDIGAPQAVDSDLHPLVRHPGAVSVHFRRGDYASNPTARAFHGLLGPDYYRGAVEQVARRVPGAVFAAFSDEPDFVERELAAELGLTILSTGDALQELRLMSRCTHHVIANSSFSWWGAWLGEKEDSVIVAPERWFAEAGVDSSSIVPERWRRL